MNLPDYNLLAGVTMLLTVTAAVSHWTCSRGTEFECSNGQCVPMSRRCDATRHCTDGSDEEDCDKCPSENRKFSRGVISSPSFPRPSAEPYCQWWIIEGGAKEVITISISVLDIPSESNDCSSDYLEIGVSPHRKYCSGYSSDATPIVHITHNNMAYIHYRTSGFHSGRGFSLQYIRGVLFPGQSCLSDETSCLSGKCILSKWLCNGVSECDDGSDEMNCSAGTTTLDPYECPAHHFSCVSVKTMQAACLPDSYLCDSYRHCLDAYDEGTGCHSHNKTCNQVYAGYHGTIQSPNYPAHYPNNLNCAYYISVSVGESIQLRFNAFQLEQMADTDTVTVYNGINEKSPVIGVYSMTEFPPGLIESTGSHMTVVFKTDMAGNSHGFNATYQAKGYCIIGVQLQCLHEENDCYEIHQRCDGRWDCPMHGGDERGCAPCTSAKDMYPCGSKESQCFHESDRCNGKGHCSNRHDEIDCLPSQCGPLNGTFLCKNRQCVRENWLCDGANDCGDNSDEIDCPLSTKVIIAAVIGSLTCSLLLVIALGCTCKLHALRMREQAGLSSPRYISPLTQVQEEILARRSAPPPYLEAMRISRNFEEVQREILAAHQSNMDSTPMTDRQTQVLVSDDDDMIDISMDPQDQNCEQESSDVQFSAASGMTAQWHRNPRIVPKPGDNLDVTQDLGDTASGSNDILISNLKDDAPTLNRAGSLDSVVSDERNMETIIAPPDPIIHLDSDLESFPDDDVALINDNLV